MRPAIRISGKKFLDLERRGAGGEFIVSQSPFSRRNRAGCRVEAQFKTNSTAPPLFSIFAALQRRRFQAQSAQFRREFVGVTVRRPHFARAAQFNVAVQIGVIGVIADANAASVPKREG